MPSLLRRRFDAYRIAAGAQVRVPGSCAALRSCGVGAACRMQAGPSYPTAAVADEVPKRKACEVRSVDRAATSVGLHDRRLARPDGRLLAGPHGVVNSWEPFVCPPRRVKWGKYIGSREVAN